MHYTAINRILKPSVNTRRRFQALNTGVKGMER